MAGQYPIIKQYILEKINEHEYQEGELLPTEKFFTETFHVSRMTVRRAFDELILDGILVRLPSRGVAVARKKISRSMHRISSQNDEELKKIYETITVKVLEVKKVSEHHLVRKVFGKNIEVYQVRRIQYGNHEPIVYENMFFPCGYFSAFTAEECETTLSEMVGKHFNHAKKKTHNVISVEALIATKTLSQRLNIPVNSAVLQITNIVMINDQPYYFGINSYAGNKFSYQQE